MFAYTSLHLHLNFYQVKMFLKKFKNEEKRIEMGKEDLQSKPEAIREKIVEGRLQKILAQRCLLEQPFVKDPGVTVKQFVEVNL